MNIYKITNRINGKVYIGQTIQKNPKMRWYGHLGDARAGTTGHLYESIRKYGPEQFDWEVIDSATTLGELNTLEVKWIEHYKASGEIYNHRKGGDNSLHSDESIQRMRIAQKAAHARRRAEGRDTWKRRDGGAMLGKAHPAKGTKRPGTMTEEVKENMRQIKLAATYCRGKSWKVINGKRVWLAKEN